MMVDRLMNWAKGLVHGHQGPASLVILTLLVVALFYFNDDIGEWHYLGILGGTAGAAAVVIKEASAALTRKLPGKKYPIVYRLVMLGTCLVGLGILQMLHHVGYFYGDHPSLALLFEALSGGAVLVSVFFAKTPSREVDPADRKQDL